MNEREAYIGLNMISGLGPVRVRALVAALGSPAAVFSATDQDLRGVKGIGPELAGAILAQRDAVDPAAEIQRTAAQGWQIVTALDPAYPEPLKTIHDPPLALYVMGTLAPADRHALALVGSRRCTHYGQTVADRLAFQLVKVGYTVVSGLARGIDVAAHQGALKAGGRTLAVLGSALDRLYPPECADLAQKIAGSGAVISEFPLGREPDRTTFPYRNRIVSGLCQGVIVVEAPAQSGALITAAVAAEQGRSVFAVPGRIDAPGSRGCHQLLRTGAVLVEGVEDVLKEFDFLFPLEKKEQARAAMTRPEVMLSADEAGVVRALGEGPLDVDSLARRAAIKIQNLSALLVGLEMKRVIRMLPGRIVELTARSEDFTPGV